MLVRRAAGRPPTKSRTLRFMVLIKKVLENNFGIIGITNNIHIPQVITNVPR